MKRISSAMLTGLTLVVAACGGSQSQSGSSEASKPPIKIGVMAPLSGTVAGLGAELVHGCQAYFNHINETGGINGRKVDLKVEDDLYTPAGGVAAARKLIDEDQVQAITCTLGAAVGLASYPSIEKAQIPFIDISEDDGISNPPKKYLFAVPEGWSIGTAIMLDYSLKTLNKSKIAIVYSTDAAGQAINSTVTKQLAERKLTPTTAQAVDITATDLSSQALKVKQSGAEAVVVQLIGAAGAKLAAEFAKLDYHPQILGMSAYNSPSTIKLMGPAGEGLIAIAYYYPVSSDKGGTAEFRQVMAKYFPQDQLGVNQGLGYSSAALLVDVMKKIKGEVNAASIFKSFESNGPFDQKIAPPAKFAPFSQCSSNVNCRRGQTQAYLIQVKDGKSVPITEFTEAKQ